MYACWNFYSLMCLDTWDTGNTGTICIKAWVRDKRQKELLIPFFLRFLQGGQNETN